ncbi:carcinoembryonic antigen-related cell adhesion molecule 6 isoform X2 [Labrus mixtus]|uniref:carcinoembryonic antigen-related cell adhesion molecule 6 isoform X2 n=1 Tax=Labrus mixtus TaxID=508554 RepID=UPI0029C00271|nr:carcinoembryonic antigen-related cell adhesion molecule 6 isoform X2 [Labrus mixtus]
MDMFAYKSLLFLLSFIGCRAGKPILPEGPVDAVLGKNVTLKTLVDNPTYNVIIWNFEGNNIITLYPESLTVSDLYKGRVSINRTNGYLTLSSVKSEDSGDYTITILSTTTETDQIKLRVLEPVTTVAIKSNVPKAVEHNSTVVLTCSAKGSFVKFTWLNGTAKIVADGIRITRKDEELSTMLTIRGVLRSDLIGPIVCTAGNKLEVEKSAPFNLPVYFGPDKVTITPPMVPKYVLTGSNLNLSCAAVSSPPAAFTWYHGKKMIENPGPVLTLAKIEKLGLGKKAGEYTCAAQNSETGRFVASPAVSFTMLEPVVGVKITGPSGTLTAGNSTANISCQAKSGSDKTLTWTKNGKPLTASSRVVFSSDMTSVMIKPLQKEDNGEIMCMVSNPVSKEVASHKMVVNYGPEPVTVTGVNAVEVNEPVTLTCSAASVPAANFTWKFNGTMTAVKTAQYAIEKAVYKSTGTYTCEATNAVTGKTMKANHILSVTEEGALDDGLSDGAIAGIVIAVLIALGAAIGVIMYCRQKVPVESPY